MVLARKIFSFYLEDGEKIIDVCHKHPIIMFGDLFKVLFFGFAIPAFLYYLFPTYWLFFTLWFVISFFRLAKVIGVWYHDVFLLTDQCVLDISWNGLFDTSSSRIEYHMIGGASVNKKGIWQVLFNYGDVSLKGAVENTDVVIKDAINPRSVERKILANQEKNMSHRVMRESESLKALLTSMLQQHVQSDEVEKVNR